MGNLKPHSIPGGFGAGGRQQHRVLQSPLCPCCHRDIPWAAWCAGGAPCWKADCTFVPKWCDSLPNHPPQQPSECRADCCLLRGEQTRGQAQLWGSDAGSRALLAPVQRRAEDWQTHPSGSCLSGAVSCSILGLGRHRERGRKSSRLLAPPGKSKAEGEGQAGCGAVGNESCVRDFWLGISSLSPHCSVTWLSPAASGALLAWERFRAVAAMP